MEFLKLGWEKIKSYVHMASYEGIGIIPDFVFMQNLPPEAWERSLTELETTPLGLKNLKRIVDAAQKRTEEERQAFVKQITSGQTTLVIGRDAKRNVERDMTLLQLIAEINSMSQENLNAARAALYKLTSR